MSTTLSKSHCLPGSLISSNLGLDREGFGTRRSSVDTELDRNTVLDTSPRRPKLTKKFMILTTYLTVYSIFIPVRRLKLLHVELFTPVCTRSHSSPLNH